jgi:small conductance mechanosensitive channel
MTSGIRIGFIMTAAALLLRTIHLLADRLSPVLTGIPQSIERQKRTQTLSNIARTVATTTLLIVSGMLVLDEIGIDIAPLITAAGIGGLAIGFGAQNLVRDMISGFFLVEDQIRDVVKWRQGGKSSRSPFVSLRCELRRQCPYQWNHYWRDKPHQSMRTRSYPSAFLIARMWTRLATLTEVGAG